MNLKELLAKRAELLGTVKTVLTEANAALADGKIEDAGALQEKAAGYQKQVEMYSTQIKSLQAAEAAGSEEFQPAAEPETPVTKSEPNPVRMPFETTETPAEDSVVKSVYTMKFGDDDAAVKGLIKDLYGNDYAQKRIDQQGAFVKYVRTGRVDGNEERLLKNLIMRPEQIRQDVRDGVDYKTVKATIQEAVGELGGYVNQLYTDYAYA